MTGRYLVAFSVSVDADDPLAAYERARQQIGGEATDAHVWTLPEDIDEEAILYLVRGGVVQDGT